ncbi:phytoene synthase [Natronospira proteinivora]|uniref:Phytoene synthase n=1 Tax=Natronospira proteinivora TaxID=1807133 RepID=A0ABT1G7L6_9GAMM|nr:squalene/phytoene synthase family protein [Natronospira proteinivora]MCP1726940.1 phytoene synthase [Natronospira proteinivora]
MTAIPPDTINDPELSLLRPFARNEASQAALALYALTAEIRHGILSVNDESLARVKLAWWRDELLRMLKGETNHPACVRLYQNFSVDRLDPGELMEPLEGLRLQLEAPLYNDRDELLLHAWRLEGALSVSAARLAGGERQSTLDTARDLGLSRALAQVVILFDVERRGGRCWVPADLCNEHDTRPEALLQGSMDTSLRVKILSAVARLAKHYHRGPGTIRRESGDEAVALQISATLSALAMADLKRSQARSFQPKQAGAITRLFISWRLARSLGAGPSKRPTATAGH